jgi:hypothetical protein
MFSPVGQTSAPESEIPAFPKPAQLQPGQAPFPGSLNVNPETGEYSYNFTPEGNEKRQAALVQRYYAQQRQQGVPSLAIINALEQNGYGQHLEGLKKQAYNETVAQLTRTYVGLGMDPRLARQQAVQQSLMAFPQGATDADRSAAGQILTPQQYQVLEAEKQRGQQGMTEFLQQQEVQQAGRVAGEQAKQRTLETNEAELDKALELTPHGRGAWRKLNPGGFGAETVAPENVKSIRDAKKNDYIDTAAFEKQLGSARRLNDLLTMVNELETYSNEIIKAEPGLLNTRGQQLSNLWDSFRKDGQPTNLLNAGGERYLTKGEVAALYERAKRGMMDFINRGMGTVGTQTEGDVFRAVANYGAQEDTADLSRMLFRSMKRRVLAGMTSLYGEAYGDKAVDEAFPGFRTALKKDTLNPSPERPGESAVRSLERGASPNPPSRQAIPPGPTSKKKSRFDEAYEQIRVE